jgi:hypothetical protein
MSTQTLRLTQAQTGVHPVGGCGFLDEIEMASWLSYLIGNLGGLEEEMRVMKIHESV